MATNNTITYITIEEEFEPNFDHIEPKPRKIAQPRGGQTVEMLLQAGYTMDAARVEAIAFCGRMDPRGDWINVNALAV